MNAASLLEGPNGSAQFKGPCSVTYDFGKNVGGVVSVTVGSTSGPGATLELAYTESSIYISNSSW